MVVSSCDQNIFQSGFSYFCRISPDSVFISLLCKQTFLLTATHDCSCSQQLRILHLISSCVSTCYKNPRWCGWLRTTPGLPSIQCLVPLLLFLILHTCHGKARFKCILGCLRKSFPKLFIFSRSYKLMK